MDIDSSLVNLDGQFSKFNNKVDNVRAKAANSSIPMPVEAADANQAVAPIGPAALNAQIELDTLTS